MKAGHRRIVQGSPVMKGAVFLIRRFLTVAGLLFAILVASGLIKGRAVDQVIGDAVLWALLAATVFTGSRYYQAKKGIACALCTDTDEENHPADPKAR